MVRHRKTLRVTLIDGLVALVDGHLSRVWTHEQVSDVDLPHLAFPLLLASQGIFFAYEFDFVRVWLAEPVLRHLIS